MAKAKKIKKDNALNAKSEKSTKVQMDEPAKSYKETFNEKYRVVPPRHKK